jgi:hypothetical protein
LATLSASFQCKRYGVELDAYRADQAGSNLHQVIHGSVFDVHCPVESFSLVYLNPVGSKFHAASIVPEQATQTLPAFNTTAG